jgi:hypothetical protein
MGRNAQDVINQQNINALQQHSMLPAQTNEQREKKNKNQVK